MKLRNGLRLLSIFLLFIMGCSGRMEVPPRSHPVSETWNDLFSVDLSNALYQKGSWSFVNGILIPSEDTEIWSNVSYDNYILDLEFNLDSGANSGVIVYCSHIDDWIPNSVEIQIADDSFREASTSPGKDWCGAIYGHMAPTMKMVREPGRWNRITITCVEHSIYVLLNGEEVVRLDMRLYTSGRTNPDGSEIPSWLSKPLAELPTMGHIGFQGLHGGVTVRFKNIKILELD